MKRWQVIVLAISGVLYLASIGFIAVRTAVREEGTRHRVDKTIHRVIRIEKQDGIGHSRTTSSTTTTQGSGPAPQGGHNHPQPTTTTPSPGSPNPGTGSGSGSSGSGSQGLLGPTIDALCQQLQNCQALQGLPVR